MSLKKRFIFNLTQLVFSYNNAIGWTVPLKKLIVLFGSFAYFIKINIGLFGSVTAFIFSILIREAFHNNVNNKFFRYLDS